ncbi:MAG: NAD-dependent epimerase/dehydratase family protein, partial [Desulfocapsaceae bacterium]|nr:NAD-dependent epimerase/dehydratase family protein [Desulfocapsaceae bacterium]
KGCPCTVLVRNGTKVEEIRDLKNFKIVYGDVTDKASVQKCMQDVEVVYHLAGQVGEWGVPDEKFFAVNVEGTRNLLTVADAAGVDHLIFCSTPGVQGKGYANASEGLPYHPPSIYEFTKAEAEKFVLAFQKNSKNLQVTIVRPDFVYGPGDLRRLPLYRAIRDRRFFLIGDGMALLHPTFIDDAVRGFCLLPNNPVAFGQIYNIAGPRTMTVREYVRMIGKTLGVSLPGLRLPISFARSLAKLFERVSRFSGKEPLLSLSKVDFLTKDHGSDISKAIRELGYKPLTDLTNGMKRTTEWYHQNMLL